jgi:hypothetical protein
VRKETPLLTRKSHAVQQKKRLSFQQSEGIQKNTKGK